MLARMVRSASLHCLARAADLGLLETATADAVRYDPFLRAAVRASVRGAIKRAAAATSIAPEGDGEGHHLRLAFLDRAGRLAGVDPHDVGAVTAAYAATSQGYPRKGRTFWPITTSLLVALVLAAITTVALFFRPTPEERFRKTPLATALGEPLTKYVVAIAKQQTPTGLARLQQTRDAILAAEVKAQIGDEAALELGDVLLHAANIANVAPDAIEAETKNLDASLSVLNLALAKRKVPACLDAYIVGRANGVAIWVLGYYAKRQVEVTIDGDTSTVFWGSRIDELNFTSGGGAYKSGAGRSVIISLDDLEGEVLRQVLPALGGDARLALGAGTFDASATSTIPAAQKTLTTLVRGEIGKAGLISESMAIDIAELVSRRDVVLADMRWEGRGGRKLKLAPRWAEDIKAIGDLTAKQVMKLDDRLGSPDYVRAVARVVDVYALLQEEEFVGYLHAYKDKTLESPPELKEIAGASALSRATLAARLALLARPQPFVFAELTRIATYAMSSDYAAWARRGAAVLLAALERELEGSAQTVWLGEGVFDRDGLADAIVRIGARTPDQIRGAADRAYTKMFKRPVPKLERRAL